MRWTRRVQLMLRRKAQCRLTFSEAGEVVTRSIRCETPVKHHVTNLAPHTLSA